MKRWLKTAEGDLLLTADGNPLAKITDKEIEIMGYQGYRLHQTQELSMKFAEKKCDEIALIWLKASLNDKI